MSLTKVFSRFLLFIIFFSTSAFAQPLRIVTVTEDLASIAKFIGGDTVLVTPLIKGSVDLHQIEAKPSMVFSVKRADLLIRIGMDQDSWLDALIQTAGNPKVFRNGSGYLDASATIQKLDVPSGAIDGRSGDIHLYGNPHYLLDPSNGKVVADAILKRLIALNPSQKALYLSNFNAFSNTLSQKLPIWNTSFSKLKQYQVVSYHTTFRYLLAKYGAESSGALEPLPGVPPTLPHLIKLQTRLSSSSKPILILMEPYFPLDTATRFSQKVNGKVVVVPTNVASPDIPDYFSMFDRISSRIP